jgi:hypothetical protein
MSGTELDSRFGKHFQPSQIKPSDLICGTMAARPAHHMLELGWNWRNLALIWPGGF